MGRLIKNQLARLIVLTAAAYNVAACIEAFIWPKIFWDFITKNLDGAVKPVPYLQIINIVLALIVIAWEWPLKPLAKLRIQQSMELRIAILPLLTLLACLLYQATNAAIYFLVGEIFYLWAYAENEKISPIPWKVIPASRPKVNDSKV